MARWTFSWIKLFHSHCYFNQNFHISNEKWAFTHKFPSKFIIVEKKDVDETFDVISFYIPSSFGNGSYKCVTSRFSYVKIVYFYSTNSMWAGDFLLATELQLTKKRSESQFFALDEKYLIKYMRHTVCVTRQVFSAKNHEFSSPNLQWHFSTVLSVNISIPCDIMWYINFIAFPRIFCYGKTSEDRK